MKLVPEHGVGKMIRFNGAASRCGLLVLMLMIAGCGGGGGDSPDTGGVPVLPTAYLKTADVQTIISQAVTRAVADGAHVAVAVVDREDNVLGVFNMTGVPLSTDPPTPLPDSDAVNGLDPELNRALVQNTAIEKARTASFLSTDQNAFSTTTGFQLVGPHFPAGVANASQGPLFQLTMSQLPCSDVRSQNNPIQGVCRYPTANGTCSNGITGAPGGIPVYVNGEMAGGIGVEGTYSEEDEVIALAGTGGIYTAPSSITANNIFLGGIRLPYKNTSQPPALPLIAYDKLPGTPVSVDQPGPAAIPGTINDAPPDPYPHATFAGVEGDLRFPIIDGAPVTAPDGTSVNLTKEDVTTIIGQSVDVASQVRAAIRSPIGVPARMHVGITDMNGTIIGEFSMNDATGFSFDIVIQKGRTVTAFSDPTQTLGQEVRDDLGIQTGQPIAFTSRSLEFIAEPFYPPGINANGPGPLNGIQLDLYKDKVDAPKPEVIPSCAPYMPGDGVCLFPGSAPLYKNGVLVGGLGLSGDGVDQDDYITAGGARGFEPPSGITADHITYLGTPLPYLKFPRHPLL
jgi:uncharacterized protein GlcG (DUF336 family)